MAKNILESFDLMGVNFTFLNNTKSSKTSVTGGILSIISLFIAFIYTINLLYNWFSISYYSKYYQTDFSKKPEINLKDNSKFMLAFCIGSESNSTYRDYSVIDILNQSLSWSYTIRQPWLIEGNVNIPLEKCKQNMFPRESVNTLTFRIYESCLCADNSKLSKYNISFSFTDTFHSYLTYIVNFKDYILEDPVLLKEAIILLEEHQSRNFIYYVDSIGKIDDHSENFFSNYLNWKVNYLNPYTSYLSDVFLRKVQIKIDDNFVINGIITLM